MTNLDIIALIFIGVVSISVGAEVLRLLNVRRDSIGYIQPYIEDIRKALSRKSSTDTINK